MASMGMAMHIMAKNITKGPGQSTRDVYYRFGSNIIQHRYGVFGEYRRMVTGCIVSFLPRSRDEMERFGQ